MKRFPCYLLACAAFLTSCTCSGPKESAPPEPGLEEKVELQLQGLSLREKVGQLFCVRPEALDPVFKSGRGYGALSVTERMRTFSENYPVGGIILFSPNIDDPVQLDSLVRHLKALPGAPLLCVDEEGGRVSRIASNRRFQVERFPQMGSFAARNTPDEIYRCGLVIGTYLKEYGFDVDFAPVADVNTNPRNPVIGKRAFSSDPNSAASMAVQFLKGLDEAGIAGCLKHFPGHGDTVGDTHYGFARTNKTWEELLDCEMLPFKAGIAAGAPIIMVAHISAPKVTGSTVPSSLSEVIIRDKLRNELGYNGIIITDGMEMGAISRHYSSAEAAVRSLSAGADVVLDPLDFLSAFDAVMQAVEDGDLTEERIDESVRRVLLLKARYFTTVSP
jgi:beta-N-acetylhexosaminidase